MATTVPYWNSRKTDGVTFGFTDAQTASPVCKFATETDCSYIIKATVLAINKSTFGEANGYVFTGVFKNDGGTLTQVGSTDIDVSIEDHAGWAATFAVSSPDVHVVFTTDDGTDVWVRTKLEVLQLGAPCPHQFGVSANEYYGAT